ncbi:MAG TPA: glycosyltransferase family 39 protein [Vicinamibacterales bacterium]|nr:glycosyltransferase family 39 protein [Vicinamibacterales bacterium]
MPAAAVPSTHTTTWDLPRLDRSVASRIGVKTAFLLITSVIAFGLRAGALSTYGFSEDEINKVRAIEQYRQGQFVVNAEHPMLMKLAMWASVEAASTWNRIAPADDAIPLETAIRLPNAVAGAATGVVLFGVADLLFGAPVAAMAALFWAFDVNVISINRIGKEDTFLLFFFLVAIWCYERAKRIGLSDPAMAQTWYTASGGAFGLMLASKYFPHYLGIYALFNVFADRHPGANRPNKLRHYAAMAMTFIAVNPVVLHPATWLYWLHYVQGDMLTHHGHPYAGEIYANTGLFAVGAVPPTFYVHLLATKIPLVVLGATVAGLIELVRRRRERGATLLLMWLFLFLVPYSFAAGKFLRYALPMFTAIDVIAAVGVVAGIQWLLRKSWLRPEIRPSVAIAAFIVSTVGPIVAEQSAKPFYSLSQNRVGAHFARPGMTFPEETYDYGVREAVAAIAREAEPSGAIVSDAPAVVEFYLSTMSRPDLQVRALSAQGLAPDRTSWLIVQREHVTFENRDTVARVERERAPWRDFEAGGALAARVFRIPRS